MASDTTKAKPAAQIFDCESVPIPRGTKTRARLPRGAERENSRAVAWSVTGAVIAAALLVGALIGRFLVP